MFSSRSCQQKVDLRQWRSILSDRGRLWAWLVLTVWLFAVILPAYAAELSGTVVGVYDGDTVTALDAGKIQHKIRLAGSDAPELNQPYGRVSRQHLVDQVAGRIVVIEWTKRDKYQRLVGEVLLNGRDINITQIEAGLAWHYNKYASEQNPEDRQHYAHVEELASASRLSLWPPNAKRTARQRFSLYQSVDLAKSEFSLARVTLLATTRNIGTTALQITKFAFEGAGAPIYEILNRMVILPHFELYGVLTDSMFAGKRDFIG